MTATKGKFTHPDELVRQRREMPWLWRLVLDWTAPVHSHIRWISSSQGLKLRVDGRGAVWLFRFVHIDDSHKERVVEVPWTETPIVSFWSKTDQISLADMVKFVLEREARPEERLWDVVVLLPHDGDEPKRLLINRCHLRGGMGLYVE